MSKNFVIISHQRTGSNMLRKALTKHSEVYCASEIVEKIQDVSLIKKQMAENNKPVFCFLLKYDQVTGYIADFLEKNNFKLIHLKRKNKLKSFVSRMVGTGSNRHFPVTVNIEEAKNAIEYISFYEELFKENSYGNILEIFYEDMVDINAVPDEIFEFMQVKEEDCLFEDGKLNPDNLKTLVSNYEEVKKAFPQYI